MRTIILALLLVAVLANTDIQSFDVDINASPEERWSEIFRVKGDAIRRAVPEIMKLFQKRGRDPVVLDQMVSDIIELNLFPEFQSEIHAISKLSNINYKDALLCNLIYEILAFGCTSAIVLDAQGRPWLGRNLDYFLPDVLGTLLVKINWINNGKVEFITEHFAGMVGTTTGMKPGHFAISINQRDASTFEENLAYIMSKNSESPLMTLLRTLRTAGNYDQAVNMLSSTQITAPCYFQIAGTKPHQGAVIVRDFDKTVYQETLTNQSNDWFLVQTNSDRDFECQRKNMAVRNLKKLGKNAITSQTLVEKVMSIYPTSNPMTVFSLAYCPATNERHMHVRML